MFDLAAFKEGWRKLAAAHDIDAAEGITGYQLANRRGEAAKAAARLAQSDWWDDVSIWRGSWHQPHSEVEELVFRRIHRQARNRRDGWKLPHREAILRNRQPRQNPHALPLRLLLNSRGRDLVFIDAGKDMLTSTEVEVSEA